MAYTLDFAVALGAGNAGLTLEAQLVDSGGVSVGAAITTGFTAIGSGNYLWNGTIPDDHRGGVKFQVSPGGALKAFAAINPQEAEYLDQKVSEITGGGGGGGGATAAEVWSYGTRELTGFGALVTNIAAAVWAYATRKLTQSAAEVEETVAGTSITIRQGTSVSISLTGLGNVTGNTKLWMTVKDKISDLDTAAVLQWERTVGLVRINGTAATATDGAVTVNDATAGNITFTLKPVASALLEPGSGRVYDVRALIGTTVSSLTEGAFTVEPTVTRAIS